MGWPEHEPKRNLQGSNEDGHDGQLGITENQMSFRSFEVWALASNCLVSRSCGLEAKTSPLEVEDNSYGIKTNDGSGFVVAGATSSAMPTSSRRFRRQTKMDQRGTSL
jgi:hypothetical protein